MMMFHSKIEKLRKMTKKIIEEVIDEFDGDSLEYENPMDGGHNGL